MTNVQAKRVTINEQVNKKSSQNLISLEMLKVNPPIKKF